ncbi:MFS transporter, partial [uncultured Leifsonia sp.]|uniref:MFS transporter n=1 Tax=uncultured Leifsonia sp. TaxID=340359 RepID=UPI0028D62820
MTLVEQSYRGATLKLVVLAAAMFVVGTNAFVIAGLLPRVAAGLGSTAEAVSYSITIYSLLVAVAAPAVSILLPRVPRAALMAVGLAVFAAGTAVAALAPNLGVFIAGRSIAGIGGAALVPTATAAAASLAAPEKR